MVTNLQLFEEGRYIDQWDYEDGDIEVLVEWEGLPYVIVTSRDNSEVRHPDVAAVPSMTHMIHGETTDWPKGE
jgi:hypothetical protein